MFRRARSLPAWLALFALALQLAVPLWHVPPAAAAAMLCPEHAMMGGAMGGMNGQPDPAAPKPAPLTPGKSCPICQVAHAAGTGLLPAPTAIAAPVEFSTIAFIPPPDDRVVEPVAPHPSSRGPPAA